MKEGRCQRQQSKSLTVSGTRFYTLGISLFSCKIISKDSFLTLSLMLSVCIQPADDILPHEPHNAPGRKQDGY